MVLSAYTCATQCPVLRRRMLLPARYEAVRRTFRAHHTLEGSLGTDGARVGTRKEVWVLTERVFVPGTLY
eukprot:2274134-Rhodomonas_salina.1